MSLQDDLNRMVEGMYSLLSGLLQQSYVPEQIIQNGDMTILKYADGETIITKPCMGDEYHAIMGVAVGISKRVFGGWTPVQKIINEIGLSEAERYIPIIIAVCAYGSRTEFLKAVAGAKQVNGK